MVSSLSGELLMQEYYSICTNSKIYSVVVKFAVFMAIPMYLYCKFVYANGASACTSQAQCPK
jgi:hypothetical protein